MEIKTYSDEGKPIRTLSFIDSARVEHYSDFVEYLAKQEIARCNNEGFNPTPSQIAFFKKEATRYAIIRRDMETAQKLRIKSDKLFEG